MRTGWPSWRRGWRSWRTRCETKTIPVVPQSSPNPLKKFDAKNRDAVDADVMPEHITMNATKNVAKWMPNALCVYSAAPAACGYLVTNSR